MTGRQAAIFWGLALTVGVVHFALYARYVGLTGDEGGYLRGAQGLAAFALGQAPPPDLIELGWHMPGLPIILAPSQMLGNSTIMARIAMYLLNAGLLFFSVALLRNMLGNRIATAYGVLMAFSPLAVTFAFFLWGDLIGGQLAILSVLLLVRATKGANVHLGFVILCALTSAVAIYMRSNLLTLVPLTAGGLFLSAILNSAETRLSPTQWLRFGMALVIVCASPLALWPWSSAISEKFETRILTTTSKDLALIAKYGNETFFAELDDLHKHEGVNVYMNLQARAENQGVPLSVYMEGERRSVMAQVDGSIAFRKLMESVRRVYDDAGRHLNRNCNRFVRKSGAPTANAYCKGLKATISLSVAAFSLGCFLFMLGFVGRTRTEMEMVVLLKGVLASFLVLLLFHWGNGRYLHSFAPAMILASVLLFSAIRQPGWQALSRLGRVRGGLLLIPNVLAGLVALVFAAALLT